MTTEQKRWKGGEKVVIGRSNVINDRWAEGLIGTVDFEFDTLVYVMVRAKGMRKDRSICLHRDSLLAA